MTTQHPEALRLAEGFPEQNPRNFQHDAAIVLNDWGIAACAELRSQHARITELEAQLSAIGAGGVSPLIAQQTASPTAGMNIAQRILHVGGRDNAAGYVEFGSIQAVEALVRQVLRDLPAQQPAPSPAPATFLRGVIDLCTQKGFSPENIEAWDSNDKWIADIWRQARELLAAPADSVLEDTARLDWLLTDGSSMAINSFGGQYRVVDVSCNMVVTDWMPTQRAALDAARKQGGV